MNKGGIYLWKSFFYPKSSDKLRAQKIEIKENQGEPLNFEVMSCVCISICWNVSKKMMTFLSGITQKENGDLMGI